MTRPRNFDQLRHEVNQQIRHKQGWERLSESVNQIAGMISAIVETEGEDWVNHVPFTEEEKIRYRDLLRPHLDSIRAYIRPTQTGGANVPSDAPPTEEPVPLTDGPASPTVIAPSMMPSIDLDAAFMGLVQKTDQLNRAAESFSSDYGLLRLERDFDTQEDFHIVPEFLRVMIASLGPGGVATKQFLDKLKVPYRLVIFMIYLYLDISRLSAATMGYPTQQKTMTVILALLELFRGDWKKAILTFMGFYGTTPLLAGQMAKAFLYLFERLSPTLQDRMVYGAWDVSKSLLVGVLLSIFQLTAPISVRKPFMEMLQTMSEGKKALDTSLIQAGLEPRSDDFAPTWDEIQRLQSVNDDPTFVCSCEYEEVIKNIGDSALVKLILQLLRLPVNEEMRKKYTCVDRTPCQPYAEALKKDQAPKAQPSPTPSASLTPALPGSAPPALPALPAPPSTPALPALPALPSLPVVPAPAPPALPVVPALPALPAVPALPSLPAVPASLTPTFPARGGRSLRAKKKSPRRPAHE